MKVMNDHRSKFSNLSSWKEKPEKKLGFNGFQTHDLGDTGRASHQYRGGHGFESRWSPDFFQASLSNCLSWKIYCDDHSLLSRNEMLHLWKKVSHYIPTSPYFNSHISLSPRWLLWRHLTVYSTNIVNSIVNLILFSQCTWPGTLHCVLGQDTSLSPRSTQVHKWITLLGVALRWISIPS